MKTSFIILLFALLFGTPELSSQDYTYDHYGVDDHFISDEIYSCISDRDGFIWVGTEGGLYIYNGVDFTHIIPLDGPKYQSVYQVHLDDQGDIWFLGSDGKVRRRNCKSEQEVLTVPGVTPTAFKMGFATSQDGRHWFGSFREGLYVTHPDSTRLVHVFTDLYINAVYTHEQGLVLVTSDHILLYHPEAAATDTILTFDVGTRTRSYKDETKLYVASRDKIYTVDFERLQLLSAIPLPIGMQVIHVSSDHTGQIVIGTRSGLFALDANNNITGHPLSEYVKNKAVSFFHHDQGGNTWVSTLDDGLYRFYQPLISKVTEVGLVPVKNLRQGQSDNVVFIGGIKGNYTVLHEQKPRQYHTKEWKHDGEVKGIISDSLLQWIITDNTISLSDRDSSYTIVIPCRDYNYDPITNELFLVYLAGAFRIKAEEVKMLSNLDNNQFIKKQKLELSLFIDDSKSITTTSDGTKWCAGSYGLSAYKSSVRSLDHPLLNQHMTTVVATEDDVLFIATLDEDILIYDTRLDSVWHFLSGVRACGRFIRDMAMDQDTFLWIAHNKGLSRVNILNGELECFGSEDGLPTTMINAVLPLDSTVLLGTDLGLYQLDKDRTTTNISATLDILSLTTPYTEDEQGIYSISESRADLLVKMKAIGYGEGLTYNYRINRTGDFIKTSDQKIPLDRLTYGTNRIEIQLRDRHGLAIAHKQVVVVLTRPLYKEPILIIIVLLLLLVLLYTGTIQSLVTRAKLSLLEKLRKLQPPPLKLSLKLTDGSYIQLLVADVVYMRSAGNYIEVHANNEKLLTRMTMSKMVAEIERATPLKQIHRSYIINTNKITSINHRHVYIQNEPVPYSQSYKSVVDPLKVKLKLNVSEVR